MPDIFTGTTGDDKIAADSSIDIIYALYGDDSVLATSSNVDIYGQLGNDTIDTGGYDKLTMIGGEGDDLFIVSSGTARSNVITSDEDDEEGIDLGDDTLDVSGVIGDGGYVDFWGSGDIDIRLYSSSGGDRGRISIEEGAIGSVTTLIAGDTVYDLSNVSSGMELSSQLVYGASDADDVIQVVHESRNHMVTGLGGDDVIYAGSDFDYIFGGEGNDTLYATSMPGTSPFYAYDNVTLYGEEGHDVLFMDGQRGIALGGEGNDSLYGADNTETLEGGDGDDLLRGGDGGDVLYGGTGDDAIWAGADDTGSDIVIGGDGDDIVAGGAGSDLIVGGGFTEGKSLVSDEGSADEDGSDTIFGGSGHDTILGGGWDDTAVDDNASFDAGEQVMDENDANIIWAGSGADVIYGAAGHDTIGGGAGPDTIYAGGRDDVVYGGTDTGADTILLGDGDDIAFAAAGDDSLVGGSGRDDLYSGAGNDTVLGGDGADTIWAGGGDDLFTGGNGQDVFYFEGDSGADTITDFDLDFDRLILTNTVAGLSSMEDVQNAASDTSDGLLIDLGGGNSLLLNDLTVADIGTMDIEF